MFFLKDFSVYECLPHVCMHTVCVFGAHGRTGITDGCELLGSKETKSRSSARAAGALNC